MNWVIRALFLAGSEDFSLLQDIQPGSWFQSASYCMGYGSYFSVGKVAGAGG